MTAYNDNKPNVKQFVHLVADKNPGVEIAKCLAFIFILHDFQDTIYTLIMHKMKLYEEQRENDIKKIRGNLSSIEQYINNCSDPESLKFLTEMLKWAQGVQQKLN